MFMPNLGSFFTPPDPDPWPKNIPDPPGYGSETLIESNAFLLEEASGVVLLELAVLHDVVEQFAPCK